MSLEYFLLGFVDILGFSQMVTRDCQGNPDGPRFLPSIRDALVEAREGDPEAQFKIIQFSDSVVISRKFQSSQEIFAEFIRRVAKLQALFFNRGILSRGGIAHGKHSQDDDIIFSQALVEAYRLESTVAQFPRAVVSDDLLLLFSADGCHLARDRDGITFVDFLRTIGADVARASYAAIAIESPPADQRVRAKMRWLQDYLSARFPNGADAGDTMLFY